MNNLIIIGNGFDLAHGMKTKYSDFIIDYLNSVHKVLFDGRNHVDPLIKTINNYRGSTNFANDLTSVEQFRSILDRGSFKWEYSSPFFEELLNTNNKDTWMDIESFYYRHLLIHYRNLEQLDADVNGRVTNDVDNLNRSLEFLKEKLIAYLKLEIGNPCSRDRRVKRHFDKIYSESAKVYILNFNYTRTPEMYLNMDTHINYIHGDLNELIDEIIFGYGDEMDIYYPKLERLNQYGFIKHFKSHGYFMNNKYKELAEFVGKEKYKVHIMGHSCGLSDRVLLNSVFDNLNCDEIIVYYHKVSDTENDFRVKSVDISRHFRPESKHRMRTILNFDNCKPLID